MGLSNQSSRDEVSRRALSLVLVALPALSAAFPAEPWIEIKPAASTVTVITDAGENAGRKVAYQVVQFDRALQRRLGWVRQGDELPLLVFASADEAMVRSMAPETPDTDKDNAFASLLAASTQNVGALRSDLPEPADKERSPWRGFYRARVASLIERSLGKSAPPWLSRGLVTFFADTVVREKEILAGRLTLTESDGSPTPPPAAADFFRFLNNVLILL